MKRLYFCIIFLLYILNFYSQNNFRVMFYNVENLFDCKDNPDKDDQQFLPDALRRWNYKRYIQKLINLSKVIVASSEDKHLILIGFCEV